MSVDPDTVDLDLPSPSPGYDDFELKISRDWVSMNRIVRNVRFVNDLITKVKKKKHGWSDPHWVDLTPFFKAWPKDIPKDLQVSYPADGSPPWIPSHFVGNLHSYYQLSLIMLHRPQLAASDCFAPDGNWKRHMLVCYAAAKRMCQMQEAIMNQFGLSGLRCMQRGVGFTVYAVLTCTVLHLVCYHSFHTEIWLTV